jgi:MFS superfamily sulfate permease-like transporter
VSVLGGIRPYNRAWLTGDIVAGVTLAALAIPEVMGYSKIAGTPVITGLYTILIPIAAFALLGSSRHLVVGGDSATAAIMYAGIAGLGIAGLEPGTSQWLALASLSALITAGLLLLARIARLGFLADFISRTVLVGFLTGVGIQVAAGQLAAMLGVAEPHVSVSRASGTLIKLWDTLSEIGDASGATLAVTAAVLGTLIVFDRWIRAVPGGLVAVVGAIGVSWIFDLSAHGVATLGPVPSGLPPIGFPSGVTWHDAELLLPISASMLVVILAQSAATSRAYAVKHEEQFVEDDDLLGLSAANLAAGLSGTFVVNGSPTKTEIVDDAKGRTQVAQLTTAVVVAVVLLFLTRPLQYLPNAALAAVVFLIGIKLVDLTSMRAIYRLRRGEFAVAAITTATVVTLGVEQGIVLAIVLSLLIHVYRHYAPKDGVIVWSHGRPRPVPPAPGTESEPGLVEYIFPVGIFYANAERLADRVRMLVEVPDPPRWFVLIANGIDDVDYTAGLTLVQVAEDLQRRGIVFAISGASDSLRQELDRFGVPVSRYFDDAASARAAFRAS